MSKICKRKTGVKNFHPYEKQSIEAIIRCIEFHIEKDDFDDRLIEDKLEELVRVIVLYKESLMSGANP